MNIRGFEMWKCVPVVTLSFALAACAGPDDGEEGALESSQSDIGETSGKVLAVDFASARGRRLPVAERMKRAGQVLMDGAAESVVADLQDPEKRAQGAAATTVVRPSLRVAHVRETDDLLLINGPVADDHSEGADIGEAAARRIFDDTIARLARDGLDDVKGLDLGKVKVSRLRQASGAAGRPETLRTSVKAYVFSAPRTVNGVEVLDSNMTIGVHRSGKVASIHSRGVLPGAAPANAALAAPRDRVVSSAEIRKRVQAQFPDASIQSMGLAYVVDAQTDAKLASAVEPREVFVVFPRLRGGSGGYGRGRKVAYSVTDARDPGRYLDTQLKNDTGDVRP